MECFPLTELVTETERKPSLVDDAYARAKGRHSLVGVRPKPRDSLANEHYSAFAIVTLTVHCPYGRFRSSRNTNSRPPRSFMKRHFLTLGWTSFLNSPPAVLICGLFATIAAAHAQIRTVTQQPYPTGGNSVAWITNIPYVDGGGPQQQLDLYMPTEQKNMPLVVFVHGGGWEHGDKAGDSLNPNNLQLLWDGYAMASVNYRLAPAAIWPAQIQDCKAAIRWLKAHAHEYGYDANRIAVMGESAGGQLVAMLGTTSGSKIFDVGENLDSSSDVTCVVDLFGPADFTVFDGTFSFIGGAPKDHLDLARGNPKR